MITKHKVRALLAPLDRFPAARKTDAFPAHALSAAQRDFGDLVTLAAQGQPQVLLRNTTPVAVLLPADSASDALSSDTAVHPGAVTAGGAVNSEQPGPRQHAPQARHARRRHRFRTHRRPCRRPHLRAARPGCRDGRSAAGQADARGSRSERRRKPAGSGGRTEDGACRPTAWSCTRPRDRTGTTSSAGSSPPRPAANTARLKQGRLTEHEQNIAHQLVQAGRPPDDR